MTEPTTKPTGLRRMLAGSVNVIGWLGFGGALGWALSWSVALRDSPAHHHVALVGIIVAGLGLVTWVLGTRVLVGEVRRGVREREGESPVQARRGLGLLLAPLAAPIIGMVIALITISGGGGTGATRAVTGISAPAPEHARQTTPSAVDSEERTYVVRAGDRIQEIADRLYGSAADWTVIAKANKGRAEPDGARFVDPSVLRAGWTLLIPPLPDREAPASHEPVAAASSPGEVGRDVALFAALGGFGCLGASLFAARQRKRRRLQQLNSAAGMGPPLLEEDDARAEVELRALGDAELPDWIDAANRLLFTELVADRTVTAPRVSIVRAGPNGLELLLEEPVERSTPSFQVRDGGHTWRLDPALELAEVRARAGSDAWAYLPGLIPFAEDDNGSYLVAVGAGESLGVIGERDEIVRALGMIAVHLTSAPWGEVECYRVGPAEFSGAEPMIEITPSQIAGLDPDESVDPLWRVESFEAQPILFAQEPELATLAVERRQGIIAVIGALTDADRVLYFDHGRVSVEPLGLNLRSSLPLRSELTLAERLVAASSPEPVPTTEDLGALPAPSTELPSPGAIEARLLRAIPDLVGDVPAKIPRSALQFIVYLAAHGGHATTNKLRDAIGSYRYDVSRSNQSIWNAAGLARKAIGSHRIPPAVNQQQYTLSPDVTADWLRFAEMAKVARAAELIGEKDRAIEALTKALELVEGPPAAESRDFAWLEIEQLIYEIERTVVESAHRLVGLTLAERSFDLTAWAIEQGRLVSPEDGELRRDAMRLADARGDVGAVDAEYQEAVEAVDALELGAIVDSETDTVYARMARRRRQSRSASNTRS